MVDKWDSLRPFRITGEDLVALAAQVDSLLPRESAPYRFHIVVGKMSEYCRDLDHLRRLMMAVTSKAVREFMLTVWGLVLATPEIPAELAYLTVSVSGSRGGAEYSVRNARSVPEANGIAAAIVGFRDKHGASAFLTPAVGFVLAWILLGTDFVDWILVSNCIVISCPMPLPLNFWTAYWSLHVLYVVISFLIIAYMLWSYYAKYPPPLSG